MSLLPVSLPLPVQGPGICNYIYKSVFFDTAEVCNFHQLTIWMRFKLASLPSRAGLPPLMHAMPSQGMSLCFILRVLMKSQQDAPGG